MISSLIENYGEDVARLLLGAFEFKPATYIGEVGEKVRSELTSLVGTAEMPTCFLYDATLAPAMTIDWMM